MKKSNIIIIVVAFVLIVIIGYMNKNNYKDCVLKETQTCDNEARMTTSQCIQKAKEICQDNLF